jgi:hypothetical protein
MLTHYTRAEVLPAFFVGYIEPLPPQSRFPEWYWSSPEDNAPDGISKIEHGVRGQMRQSVDLLGCLLPLRFNLDRASTKLAELELAFRTMGDTFDGEPDPYPNRPAWFGVLDECRRTDGQRFADDALLFPKPLPRLQELLGRYLPVPRLRDGYEALLWFQDGGMDLVRDWRTATPRPTEDGGLQWRQGPTLANRQLDPLSEIDPGRVSLFFLWESCR